MKQTHLPGFALKTLLCLLLCQAVSGQELQYPRRNAYFGDLHLHTSMSYDAAWGGARTTPEDAYNYAQGKEVEYLGRKVKRNVPLDFLAVADHAEYLGIAMMILDPKGPFKNTEWPESLTMPQTPGFSKIMRSAFSGPEVIADLNTAVLKRENWQNVIDAANAFNQPGKFTAFVAFEWSNTPEGAHFHRVAIFPGPQFPEIPFSALDSRHPEDLWRYADNNRAHGIDSIMIPHNMNLSDGRQFSYNDSFGNPIDRAFAETKTRNETLVEVTQIKGTSETHPELSPDDEFAGFEILEHFRRGGQGTLVERSQGSGPGNDSPQRGDLHGSYAREGYARGFEISARIGVNPYQYGLVGSSDYHSSTSATEEDNHTGALGNSDNPIPENARNILATINRVLNAPTAALAASGITGIWAEENTRESLFAAMKRREVYATSGPRIQVRLFASPYYQDGLIKEKGWLAPAYAQGVPMGGELHKPDLKGSKQLRFLVHALKDPDGANLDRIQIVKVWYAGAASHERVFDVAWAGERSIDTKTGKLPPVGDTVDVAKAAYRNDIGAVQISGEWTDPEFNPDAPALYYARVIEIPTPRWSTYLAVRNNLPIPDTVPSTHQERAWTSPVFYNP